MQITFIVSIFSGPDPMGLRLYRTLAYELDGDVAPVPGERLAPPAPFTSRSGADWTLETSYKECGTVSMKSAGSYIVKFDEECFDGDEECEALVRRAANLCWRPAP